MKENASYPSCAIRVERMKEKSLREHPDFDSVVHSSCKSQQTVAGSIIHTYIQVVSYTRIYRIK